MALPFSTARATWAATRINAVNKENIQRRLVDQMWVEASPVLKTYLSKSESEDGELVQVPLGIGQVDVAARARCGEITAISTPSLTGAVATQGWMNKYYLDWVVMLATEDIDENKGSVQLFNYVEKQIDKTARSAKNDMERLIWTAQTGSYPYSLVDAIGDSEDGSTYLNITIADMTASVNINGSATTVYPWTSFVMDAGAETSTSTGVSPSLANHEKLLTAMYLYNGKYPDVGYTTPAVWHKLANQVAANDFLAGGRDDPKYKVTWGTRTLEILGVPIIPDRNVPAAAFVNGTNRATNLGHATYFVDWSAMHPFHSPGKLLSAGPLRDMEVTGKPYKYSRIEYAGSVYTDERRLHGKIVSIDPTIAATSYAESSVLWGGATIMS
jgi:hypothetical protein